MSSRTKKLTEHISCLTLLDISHYVKRRLDQNIAFWGRILSIVESAASLCYFDAV
jgi:hypothetical protein